MLASALHAASSALSRPSLLFLAGKELTRPYNRPFGDPSRIPRAALALLAAVRAGHWAKHQPSTHSQPHEHPGYFLAAQFRGIDRTLIERAKSLEPVGCCLYLR